MYNYTFLTGRLTKDVEVKTSADGKPVTTIVLAVSRPFKNSEGEYDVDFIPITLWDVIAETTAQYCKKGHMVNVKGRLVTKKEVLQNGYNATVVEVIAEKVMFVQPIKTQD